MQKVEVIKKEDRNKFDLRTMNGIMNTLNDMADKLRNGEKDYRYFVEILKTCREARELINLSHMFTYKADYSCTPNTLPALGLKNEISS